MLIICIKNIFLSKYKIIVKKDSVGAQKINGNII